MAGGRSGNLLTAARHRHGGFRKALRQHAKMPFACVEEEISARVLVAVENAVKVEPVGEFELKGIRRPLAAYNVIATNPAN
jgi:hypothetical protein